MDAKRAHEIAGEAIDLMARKNADYGSANIEATGLNGIAVRLMDKTHRLLNLTSNGHQPNFESIRDTFTDVMNYGLIGLMLEEGSWNSNKSEPVQYKDFVRQDARMVYLAGPIDDVSTEEAQGWRSIARNNFGVVGISCFDPSTAYDVGRDTPAMGQICAINRFAIQTCDLVFANLSGPGKAFGTIREIEYARSLGKTVVVCGTLKSFEARDINQLPNLNDAIHFAKLAVRG